MKRSPIVGPVEIISEVIEASTASGPMVILRKRPTGTGRWPRVVMFHDGPGIRIATHEFAAMLAGAGHEVVVPDLYHRAGRLIGYEPHERVADPTIIDRLWKLVRGLTDDGIQADLDATLDAIELGPAERLATIGFCLGARAVFRTMMRLPERFVAGAMWHPSFLADEQSDSPHTTAAAITQPLYIGIGDADTMQPIAAHQRFFDAVAPLEHVEIEVFAGADHGYTWPGWPSHQPMAADRSFAKTVDLFRTHLPAS